jgi:hypothetical protein
LTAAVSPAEHSIKIFSVHVAPLEPMDERPITKGLLHLVGGYTVLALDLLDELR